MPISSSVAVTIPDITFKPPAVMVTSSPNVETPVTFNWSTLIPPTTSIRLLASRREENVATPATLRSST